MNTVSSVAEKFFAQDFSTRNLGNDNASDIAVARAALQNEADALLKLSFSLDQLFTDAVDIIMACTGRVVITGMGKSGHISRKIAATLSSTGTPSMFVHPAEASHGDLGMVLPQDVVIALSNSGETKELSDILSYCKRFSIPLVAITSDQNSTLGTMADKVLLLPKAEEACPMGLAPTTSTTMMMALGDALAIAVLERRGFSAQDFKTFHPGGKLGNSLVRVSDLMHGADRVPLVPMGTKMREAIAVMTSYGFGLVGVLDPISFKLCGIITDGDLRRNITRDMENTVVEDVMTRTPKTVLQTSLAAEAVAIMNSKNITNLIVVDDENFAVGVLHIHDCMRGRIF